MIKICYYYNFIINSAENDWIIITINNICTSQSLLHKYPQPYRAHPKIRRTPFPWLTGPLFLMPVIEIANSINVAPKNALMNDNWRVF